MAILQIILRQIILRQKQPGKNTGLPVTRCYSSPDSPRISAIRALVSSTDSTSLNSSSTAAATSRHRARCAPAGHIVSPSERIATSAQRASSRGAPLAKVPMTESSPCSSPSSASGSSACVGRLPTSRDATGMSVTSVDESGSGPLQTHWIPATTSGRTAVYNKRQLRRR